MSNTTDDDQKKITVCCEKPNNDENNVKSEKKVEEEKIANESGKECDSKLDGETNVTDANQNNENTEDNDTVASKVDVYQGEENDECIWMHTAKLYRWSQNTKQWVERGIGIAKLLKDKTHGRIRFILRQDKTYKVMSNHYVVRCGDYCNIKPNVTSDRIMVWVALDSADDPPKVEQFALKFGKSEVATEFKDKFQEAAESSRTLFPDMVKQMTQNTSESTPKNES